MEDLRRAAGGEIYTDEVIRNIHRRLTYVPIPQPYHDVHAAAGFWESPALVLRKENSFTCRPRANPSSPGFKGCGKTPYRRP